MQYAYWKENAFLFRYSQTLPLTHMAAYGWVNIGRGLIAPSHYQTIRQGVRMAFTRAHMVFHMIFILGTSLEITYSGPRRHLPVDNETMKSKRVGIMLY